MLNCFKGVVQKPLYNHTIQGDDYEHQHLVNKSPPCLGKLVSNLGNAITDSFCHRSLYSREIGSFRIRQATTLLTLFVESSTVILSVTQLLKPYPASYLAEYPEVMEENQREIATLLKDLSTVTLINYSLQKGVDCITRTWDTYKGRPTAVHQNWKMTFLACMNSALELAIPVTGSALLLASSYDLDIVNTLGGPTAWAGALIAWGIYDGLKIGYVSYNRAKPSNINDV